MRVTALSVQLLHDLAVFHAHRNTDALVNGDAHGDRHRDTHALDKCHAHCDNVADGNSDSRTFSNPHGDGHARSS